MSRLVRRFAAETQGFSTAEFALVLPLTLLFVFGLMHLSLLIYSSTQLHFATETAARCFSVDSAATCTSGPQAEAYAANFYRGTATASFVASTPSCGRQVVGSATYKVTIPFYTKSFPLQATACFP